MKKSLEGKSATRSSRPDRQPVLFIVLFALLLSGCTFSHTHLGIAKNIPQFVDDGNSASLLEALRNHQRYVHGQNSGKTLRLGDKTYTKEDLQKSLEVFAEIIEMDLSPVDRDSLIQKRFTILQAEGSSLSSNKELLVTGYFEPVLEGSLKRNPPFIYPIYAVPDDLLVQTDANGVKVLGRIAPEDGNIFKPYWTREQIDGSTRLQGKELVFLKDRFDAFLLHVQGSGKIRLQNGEMRSIRYAGNNGHPYSSIGKLLVDEKKLTLSEAGIPRIRGYLRDNPEEMTRVLGHNRRYIFFDWSSGESPLGSSGVSLTPERSIAIDRDILPMETVAFLQTRRPVLGADGKISYWQPMNRFVFPQDTGAAIKGSGRVDLFWGTGDYAEKAAGAMKERGKLYFLIIKDTGEPQ